MVTWNLKDIISKIRNITGTPISNDDSSEMSDELITAYVNSYYTFTMPFELKEQINLQPLDFFALPNIDVYPFPSAFLTDQPMAYADGFPLIFYQDRDIFFQDWPQQYAQDPVATGDGITTVFAGNAQYPPIIQGTFLVTDGSQVVSDEGSETTTELIAVGTGVVAYNDTLSLIPVVPGSLVITDGVERFTDDGVGILTGSLGGNGTIVYATGVWSVTFNTAVAVGVGIYATYSNTSTLRILSGSGTGVVDNVTGAFTVTFDTAPSALATIYAKYQGYQPARPQGVLWYDNVFTFRPIPDQVYQITMQGYINQLQFDVNNQTTVPLQTEWGQLIAYGASLEIFSDRGDLVAYNNNYPIMKRYENVALARTVQQYEASQSVPRF